MFSNKVIFRLIPPHPLFFLQNGYVSHRGWPRGQGEEPRLPGAPVGAGAASPVDFAALHWDAAVLSEKAMDQNTIMIIMNIMNIYIYTMNIIIIVIIIVVIAINLIITIAIVIKYYCY